MLARRHDKSVARVLLMDGFQTELMTNCAALPCCNSQRRAPISRIELLSDFIQSVCETVHPNPMYHAIKPKKQVRKINEKTNNAPLKDS